MKSIQRVICVFVCLWIAAGPAVVGAGEQEDISTSVEAVIEGSPLPAMAVAVIADGELKAAGAAGVRVQGSPAKAMVSDKFHLGSLTKSMTAVVTAMFVEEGKLSYDTAIVEVLKDWEVHPDFQQVTVRQLLSHRAGFPNFPSDDLWQMAWRTEGTDAERRLPFVKGILAKAPAYKPGTRFLYSNLGYAVVGAMLEQISGESYESLMKSRLFEPLSLESAGFGAPGENGKTAQPFGHVVENGAVVPVNPLPGGDNPPAIAAAGRVHMSVTDLAEYARFHLGKTGTELLNADSRQKLYEVEGDDYALGWIVTQRPWAGGTALTHSGSNTMFYATLWIAPEKDFAVAVVTNYGGPEAAQKCDQAVGLMIQKFLKN